jgi:EmrB/QacA subfamily drug resistance transporter
MSSAFKPPCDEGIIKCATELKDLAPSKGTWVLAATIIGSSITFIDGTVVNVALPILQEKLNASVTQMQWVVESYALMLSALILVGGALGDKYGRKLVYSIGVVIFALSSLWCGLVSSAVPLIIARAVQGVGAALLVPGSLAIISATFPKKERGKAIGTWSGFTSIAAGFGPVLGGWLIENISWRWIFFINLPLAVIVLLITWRHVPESRNENAKKGLDWPGALLATLGLGGIVYGLTESSSLGFSHPMVFGSMIGGAIVLVLFVIVEARGRNPMMPLELFKSSSFTGANLLTLFLYAALGGLLFFLPFNLIQIQGYGPTAAGSALVPFVLMMFLLSRWAGGLIDRFGAKLPLIIGPVITGIGFGLFIIPGVGSSYWTTFLPAIIVMSFGMSISVAPLTTTVMGSVDEHHAGVASGINNAVSRTASLLAIAVFGVAMLVSFNRAMEYRLASSELPAQVKTLLEEQKTRFTNIDTSQLPPEMREQAVDIVKGSFVSGFRLVALIGAGLAFASALCSFIFIDSKDKLKKTAP